MPAALGNDFVEEQVPLQGEPLRIRRPRDFEELLTEESFEREELLPYWAELWASGIALAAEVAVRSLRGARTLELGCGLALPSIASARAGGRATATDWAPQAVELAADNAALNDAVIEGEVASWAEPDTLVARAPWDIVLASDVLYDRRNVALLLGLLPRLVDARGEIWIADPGRPPAEQFFQSADRLFTRRSTQSPRQPRVTVHRLRKR